MRLASFAHDVWELESAEERHRAHPESFWIPPLEARSSLARGQAAKLIFLVEETQADGRTVVQGERMWVLVAGRRDDVYLGILDNQPATAATAATATDADDWYLVVGAEVPFRAEHVIDIAEPPPGYAEARLAVPPARRWMK